MEDEMRGARGTYVWWKHYIQDLNNNNCKLQPTRCNVSWFVYFYRRCTCFRRFLHPSSGTHNPTYSFGCCQPILLLAGVVDEMFHLIHIQCLAKITYLVPTCVSLTIRTLVLDM